MRHFNFQARKPPRGSVLVLVLIVIAMLTLGAFGYSQRMQLEFTATRSHGKHLQARSAAESGIEYIKYMLMFDKTTLLQNGGVYLNPQYLQGILITPDDPNAAFRARFTCVAPDQSQDGYYSGVLRYGGIENESAKLNLNAVLLVDQSLSGTGRTLLMSLPGMTEAIADAILDWMDSDDTTRELGAEASQYSIAQLRYSPRNGPLQSLEELLLVRDVTPALLFGADLNRDGLVQDWEKPLINIDNVNNNDGTMFRGWSAYLTVDSAERNARPDGRPKIDVNTDDLTLLQEQLSEFLDADQVGFILAYRQGGVPVSTTTTTTTNTSGTSTSGTSTGGTSTGGTTSGGTGGTSGGGTGGGGTGGGGTGGGGTGGGGTGGGGTGGTTTGGTTTGGTGTTTTQTLAGSQVQIDVSQTGNVRLSSILDLIGATATAVPMSQTQAVNVINPFTEDAGLMQQYLPLLSEHLAVNAAPTIPGRLNINQAPRLLLAGIPGMNDVLLEQIIGMRDMTLGAQQSIQMYDTWLLMSGLVDLATMKQLLPIITSGGDVYRARVVGYYEGGGPMSRMEVVIDATKRPPVILRRWELDNMGQDAGYFPENLGTATGSTTVNIQ